ncbi:MAG: polysaccharide biosynthesis protein [Bacteroidetes bacterium]|nr:MAG: polysaccharide biosynthesis protein [Bacteroidota bacterium]
MGIIRRQSIQTTVLSYLGFGLGYVNTVLLFPAFFQPDEYGLTRVLIAIVGVASQFALFGMTNAIVRFFPRFNDGDPKRQHGLLGLSLFWGLLGAGVVSLIMLLGRDLVVSYKNDGSNLIDHYYLLLFPYLVFEVVYQLLAVYTRALYHSVVNVFFKEVFLRAITTVLILLYFFELVSIDRFMMLFVVQYGVIALGLALYLIRIGNFSLAVDRTFLTPELSKEMLTYRSYTMLTNASAFMLMNIDVLMITYMIGLEMTAFYAVAFYVVALMNIPRNAISNISLPVIADAWKREDLDTVQRVYEKTSINQLLMGTFIFVGIWANEGNIFQILPEAYSGGKWVLFFVGLARLADVGFGMNGGVISTSKWYRFDTYSNLILLAVTVLMNLVFIPMYGIAGAALATAISLLTFNIIKYVFLKVKFGFDPFGWKTAATIVLGIVTYLISAIIPVQEHFIIDIVFRSVVITVVFGSIAVGLKLSEDVNDFLRALIDRFYRR